MNTTGHILFGTTTIDYDVTYSERRRHAAIAVHPDKRVEIVAPATLDAADIQKLVRMKASWVVEQLEWFGQIEQLEAAKEYVNGETFLYLGRQYRLKILYGDELATKLKGRYLEVTVPAAGPEEAKNRLVKEALWQWYHLHAEKKIGEVVKIYAAKLRINPPRFRVKYQEKRWGSCPKDDFLHINVRIAMAPMSQVEYVVAHELCHLRYKDHSAAFWQHLRYVMPDYELRKESLKKDGWKYVL
jgi:predicted metal-dependent hydrolase